MRHLAWNIDYEERIIYTGESSGYGIAEIDKHKNIILKYWNDSKRNKKVLDNHVVKQLRNDSYYIPISYRTGLLIVPELCHYWNWGLVANYAPTNFFGPVNKLIYSYCEEHYFLNEHPVES